MDRRSFIISTAFAATANALRLEGGPQEPSRVRLSSLTPRYANHGWAGYTRDTSVDGKPLQIGVRKTTGGPLQIGDRKFEHGVGTYGHSDLVYFVSGRYSRFHSWVGVDIGPSDSKDAPTAFQVWADGKKLFDSGAMQRATPAKEVDIDLTNVNVLRLVALSANTNYSEGNTNWDGIGIDDDLVGVNIDWAQAELIPARVFNPATPPTPRKSSRQIQSGKMVFTVGKDLVSGLLLPNGKHINLQGSMTMGPYVNAGADAKADVSSKFHGASDGLAWEWGCESTSSKPWTTTVDTLFKWPNPSRARVFIPWGHGNHWEDPLVTQLFEDKTYEYGAFFVRTGGAPLPMATIIDQDAGIGITFIQSPKDVLLNMLISTTADGEIRFSRAFHRFGGKFSSVSFHMDIVVHEPDIRAALRAIVDRYPEYFEPPNQLAHTVGGGGAYSGYEGPLDARKLAAMGYTMNWKASIDFPYMGQFLPPVPDNDQWDRYAGGGGAGIYDPKFEGRFGKTSIAELRNYSVDMKAHGFHVLNYFNITEFGSHIFYPRPPRKAKNDSDVWKDPNDFLYATFENAILKTPDPTWTWGGAVVMDPAEPAYRQFLIDQAKLHLEKIPDSSGICIDRMDWLTRYNPNADDGVSWIDGPYRHLRRSWIPMLQELGEIFHNAGKVIFVNDMECRLDLMRYVDGIYDEHGNWPFCLNSSAFLALRRPLVSWTPDNDTLKPDPDAYFQRHLYLGAFPTIPVPGNDHTIVPDEWNEPLYLAYGPLFNAIKARKWILTPGVVEVEGNSAKANAFETPQGYVVFVGLAPAAGNARVTVRGLNTQAKVLHPGEANHKTLSADGTLQSAVFDVPLKHGCAMLLLARG
jgi:hypothetical protein